MVQMSSSQGVLFLRNENEEYKWFQDGDEDKDGKYVGEFKNGKKLRKKLFSGISPLSE